MGSSYCPSWLFNSVYESPCTVWAKLGTICTSDFVVPSSSIDLSNYHAADNRCQCNIVAYNLMSACATCTGKRFLREKGNLIETANSGLLFAINI
ncbi:hypothetical protein FRC20_006727, partial [Serendipita sp. 405]